MDLVTATLDCSKYGRIRDGPRRSRHAFCRSSFNRDRRAPRGTTFLGAGLARRYSGENHDIELTRNWWSRWTRSAYSVDSRNKCPGAKNSFNLPTRRRRPFRIDARIYGRRHPGQDSHRGLAPSAGLHVHVKQRLRRYRADIGRFAERWIMLPMRNDYAPIVKRQQGSTNDDA